MSRLGLFSAEWKRTAKRNGLGRKSSGKNQKGVLNNMAYSFKNAGHQHLWNGKRMTGITTVLSVIAKPQLIPWAAKMATEHVAKKWEAGVPYAQDAIDEILSSAKTAHVKKKESAGDIGTAVHRAIEQWLKDGVKPTLDEQGIKMFNHFPAWLEKNKARVLKSEQHLYSVKMFLGGIMDLLVEIDGEVWIADIKTGSGIYAEAFWQMGGYELLLKDMGFLPSIKGYIVLNLQKSGNFEEKRSISNEDNREAFMSAYKLYRISQKINSQIL